MNKNSQNQSSSNYDLKAARDHVSRLQNYTKPARGEVFWLDVCRSYNMSSCWHSFYSGSLPRGAHRDAPSHLQFGRRPVIVVSNNMGNNSSPCCSVVPCTTSTSKADLPVHVHFCLGSIDNTALCEHIMTVDCELLVEFITTLPSDVMKRVDAALAIQIGLVSANGMRQQQSIESGCSAADKLQVLQDKLQSKMEQYETALHALETAVSGLAELFAFQSIADKLEQIYASVTSLQERNRTDIVIDVPDNLLNAPEPVPVVGDAVVAPAVAAITGHRYHARWTGEEKLAYIKAAENVLTINMDGDILNQFLEQWGLSSYQSAKSAQCRFKREMGL